MPSGSLSALDPALASRWIRSARGWQRGTSSEVTVGQIGVLEALHHLGRLCR